MDCVLVTPKGRVMRSEAVSTLRSWAKDRLGEQEEQLRVVERSVLRLGELEAERHKTLGTMSAAVTRLGDLGLDETCVAGFVGVDITAFHTGRGSTESRMRRHGSAPPSNALT
jgi:hypothetical protein